MSEVKKPKKILIQDMSCESSIRTDVKNKTIDQWQAYHTSLLERLEREVILKGRPNVEDELIIPIGNVLDLIKQAKEGKL